MKSMVQVYEDSYNKTLNKDTAYSAIFEHFFKGKEKEKFYSKHYINQYIKSKSYKSHSHSADMGKLIRAVTNGRYVDDKKVLEMTVNDFRLSQDSWYDLNEAYCNNSGFDNKSLGLNNDDSYMSFSAFDYSEKKTLKEFQKY